MPTSSLRQPPPTPVPRAIRWACHHPFLLGVLATVYFLALSLNHEKFGILIADTFNINERASYNHLFLQMALAAGAFYLFAVVPSLIRQKNWLALTYLMLTLVLSGLAVQVLMVVMSETIHFPQYALLAMLLFPVLRSFHLTLSATAILGAIDEGLQYWYLSPQRTDYYDFNDVVLNFLGAVLGVLVIGAWSDRSVTVPRHRSHWNGLLIAGALLLLLLAWSANVIDFVPPQHTLAPAPLTLVRKASTGLWASIPMGLQFHILRPLPGLGLLLLLTALYYPLDRVLGKAQ